MRSPTAKLLAFLVALLMSPIGYALTGAKDLDAGQDFFCAVDAAGVKCWGDDRHGQSSPPNLSGARAVSAGTDHACAIASDQTVHCWGSNDWGQSDPSALQPAITGAREIAAGNTHSCAVHSGGVSCWGADFNGILSVPPLQNPHSLDVDGGGACVIDSGQVVCWGQGEWLQPPVLSNPVLLSGNCAVDDTGLVCWGSQDLDPIPSVSSPRSLSVSGPSACVTEKGIPKCWTRIPFGLEQPPAIDKVVAIATNVVTACAISRGNVYCWGHGGPLSSHGLNATNAEGVAFDDYGASGCEFDEYGYRCFGENSLTKLDGYVPDTPVGGVVATAVHPSGTVCWIDERGLICQNRNGTFPIATPLMPSTVDFDGSDEGCVLYAGNISCFDITDLESGLGTIRFAGATDLSMASRHSCAVVNGSLKCWGDDNHGQAPELAFEYDPRVSQVATGNDFTCIIHSSYGVSCFGRWVDSVGESDGALSPPFDLIAPSEIDAGKRHACVIDSGKVHCWGENRSGQTTVPDAIEGPYGLVLSAEGSCVFDQNDQLHCWGALDGIGQGNVPQTRRCLGQYVTVDMTLDESPTEDSDVIWGTDGDDYIDALGGDDRVCANLGRDYVWGGEGDDRIKLGGEFSTGYGGPGNDWLQGTSFNDHLDGGYGDDRLLGLDGNDSLYGDEGDDSLYGGNGDDSISGGSGSDLLNGGDGDDYIDDHTGDNKLLGGAGDDQLYSGDGVDRLAGGSGHDRLVSGEGNDLLNGGGGNDVLLGGAGDDRLYGLGGRDFLVGGDGDDILNGGSGDDELEGGEGADRLYGHVGKDHLSGGAGRDTVQGGSGADTLLGNDGDDRLLGGSGNDLLDGGAGADTLTGGAGLRDRCQTDILPIGDVVSTSCEMVGF